MFAAELLRPLAATAALVAMLSSSASGLVLSSFGPGPELSVANNYFHCRVSSQYRCTWSDLKPNLITMVMPGGRTRCISNNNPAFAFQIVPRDVDKLLLIFEGGGACWNKATSIMGTCRIPEAKPRVLSGIMSDEVGNPFRNHTVAYVPACSGDMHSGDVSHEYTDLKGRRFEQHGFQNTRSVLDWVKANMGAQKLSSLMVVGLSAGSIGVQVWAGKVLSELQYEHATVLADSYVGAFPEGFQGPVFQELNICTNGLLDYDRSLIEKCHLGTISIPDTFEAAMKAFPEVQFASLDSKYDEEQKDFYTIATMAMGRHREFSKLNLHSMMTDILKRFKKYPNHAHLIVPASWHVFTSLSYFEYGEWSAKAYHSTGSGGFRHIVDNWLTRLSLNEKVGSQCVLLSNAMTKKLLSGVHVDTCDPELGSEVVHYP